MSFTKDELNGILTGLRATHPDPVCELNYNTPYELLVAVVLSAQCTDKRVNKVTAELFKLADNPYDMVKLPIEVIAETIRSVGCFNRKSQSIMRLSQSLIDNYGGIVPESIDELVKLDGVGRKTANVMQSVAFHGDAIAVDTHVQRVSNRIGLATSDKVEQTERQLMELLDKSDWSETHHLLIHHGRYVCMARNPKCNECAISKYCRFFNLNGVNKE